MAKSAPVANPIQSVELALYQRLKLPLQFTNANKYAVQVLSWMGPAPELGQLTSNAAALICNTDIMQLRNSANILAGKELTFVSSSDSAENIILALSIEACLKFLLPDQNYSFKQIIVEANKVVAELARLSQSQSQIAVYNSCNRVEPKTIQKIHKQLFKNKNILLLQQKATPDFNLPRNINDVFKETLNVELQSLDKNRTSVRSISSLIIALANAIKA